MVRAREFDEETALDASMRVFWSEGYAHASMQRLERAMGIGRASLYNAFGSKRGLFRKSFSRYVALRRQGRERTLAEAPDARSAIERVLLRAVDFSLREDNPGGCLIALSAAELELHDHETRMAIRAAEAELVSFFERALAKARSQGRIGADLDLRGAATLLAAGLNGIMVLAKAGVERDALRAAARALVARLG